MDFKERNKKVAISRWLKIHSKEREKILGDLGINAKYYTYLPKNKKYSRVHIVMINNNEELQIYGDKIVFGIRKSNILLKKSLVL
ncbi:MAG: hypothetical protein WC758_01070 [Candidatus Woesearchaeota archaeon]|jgi:hypothetical protein